MGEAMTVVGETKQVSAQITRLVWAEGKDGAPQWEVQLRWPWTPAANKGGDKTWVAQADFPAWTAATKGAVNLEVAAGYIKRAGEGKEPFDGHLDWMWHWGIKGLLDHAPVAAPVALGGSQDDYRRSKEEMRWTEAINNATQRILHPAFAGYGIDDLPTAIFGLAESYYKLLIAGPPQDMAQDDATEATEASEVPEPPQPPPVPAQPPQRASQEALTRLNGARQAALARHQWATEEESLAAIQGYAKRLPPVGREVRQLTDAEVGVIAAAVREGKI